MNDVLFHYEKVNPTSWVYLSSLLLIGLFFKFGRFWSVRNLDVLLLILFAPGLLLVDQGLSRQQSARRELAAVREELEAAAPEAAAPGAAAFEATTPESAPGFPDSAESTLDSPDSAPADPITSPPLGGRTEAIVDPASEPVSPPDFEERLMADPRWRAAAAALSDSLHWEHVGYFWLLVVSGIFLIRLLIDPTMVRRPLLDPNLSTGGLTFIGCSLFVFLMANVVNSEMAPGDAARRTLDDGVAGDGATGGRAEGAGEFSQSRRGPGYELLDHLPRVSTSHAATAMVQQPPGLAYRLAQILAIGSQLALVLGMVLIGLWHFENIKMGIGAATMYLMLPYTAQLTGSVDHVLPAALLVWAVALYRRPLSAGIVIGLSVTSYYPLFLLPLWISFYWQRGLMRFLSGTLATMGVLSLLLLFGSASFGSFLAKLLRMYGLMLPQMAELGGIWGHGWDPIYRIPLLAAFVALSGSLAIWPAQKNLGTLLSCSAAVMVATQFWHGNGGGLFMAWYLPLMLLTIFRPNLEDRIALSVLGEGWFRGRRTGAARRAERAA